MKYITKLISFFEITAILLFIVFEKSVWSVALWAFNYIKKLEVFNKVNDLLAPVGEKVILTIFGIIFLLSKFMSLAAVTLIGNGYFLSGILVYLLTFPVGAISIWLLEMQKDKLMSFTWFKWSYEMLMSLLDKLKQSAPYQRVRLLTADIKLYLVDYKANLLDIRNNRKAYTVKLKKKYKAVSRLLKRKYRNHKRNK